MIIDQKAPLVTDNLGCQPDTLGTWAPQLKNCLYQEGGPSPLCPSSRQVGLGCVITSIATVLNKVSLAALTGVRMIFTAVAMKRKHSISRKKMNRQPEVWEATKGWCERLGCSVLAKAQAVIGCPCSSIGRCGQPRLHPLL